jgi:hypothetical protein
MLPLCTPFLGVVKPVMSILQEWLTDVLNRIPEYNNNYNLDLADFLPHNWKASKDVQQNPGSLQE